MKKTFNLEDKLIQDAKAACGATTYTETVRLGLQALIRHAAYQRMRAMLGTEKGAVDVPRRREKALAKRQAA